MKCLLYLLDYDFIIIEQTRFFTKGPFPVNRINKNLLQKVMSLRQNGSYNILIMIMFILKYTHQKEKMIK